MILITGGAGYIGSHTAVELLKEGHPIVVVDNLSNSSLEAIRRIKELTGKEFPFYQVDLQDFSSLNEVFLKHGITAVMHFAGLKSVNESMQVPLMYYQNNIAGTLNLCEIMDNHSVKKLVFSSSATVYGEPQTVPIDESSPLLATNPYGRTKLMIEEILQDLVRADGSWRIAILRYFNPVGAHESGRIGENPSGVPNNLMPYMTQVALGLRDCLQVFGNDYDTPDGTGIRDYIHIMDLAKGHSKALCYVAEHEGIEAFNLGTGIGYSVLDLIHKFREVTLKELPYEISKRRPGDVGVCYADTEKARTILKWQAEKGLKEMCRDAWAWQIGNSQGYSSMAKGKLEI